jgi:hypothetical protein
MVWVEGKKIMKKKNIKLVGWIRADSTIFLKKPKNRKKYIKLLVSLIPEEKK